MAPIYQKNLYFCAVEYLFTFFLLIEYFLQEIVYAFFGGFMNNEKAIKALEQVKTYVSANSLDELDYAIEVLKKLEKEGVKDPLNTDFSAIKK